MPRPREGSVIAAFAAIAVLVGGNAVGIRFSNRELDPLWGAGLRFALAATVLAAAMAVLGLELPRGRALTGALLFGLLDVGGAFALGYYALVELHAGFGSILLALVPLATLLLAVLQGQERLRVVAVAGTVVALVGVALMSRAPLRESLPVLSVLAALGSALCIAQATVVVRRFPPVHPVTMNAVAMAAGAAVLIAGSVLAGESLVVPQRARHGSRSPTSSSSARSSCSCSTSSCFDTGTRRARRTCTCSSRSPPSRSPRGSTTSRSGPDWCSEVSWF